MKALHPGRVTKGKLILDNPERWQVNLAKYEGKPVELSINQKRSTRSNNQNSYYWGIVLPILAESTGYAKHEHEILHEQLKYKFLMNTGKNGSPYVKSTTSLNTKEFEEYMSDIRVFASAELNCYIPEPNSIDF